MKRKGLGKGLNAILESANQTGILKVDISKIKPNPKQPRREFDEVALEELAQSIKENGIIQPIIVTKREGGYEIVAGERRYRAARKAGLKEIEVIVKEYDDQSKAKLALIENIQRENLNPIDEAVAINSYIEMYKLTHQEAADVIGKSRVYVSNLLRLLQLPDKILNAVIRGELTQGHARVLVSVTPQVKQMKLFEKVLNENLSVRELEELVSQKESEPKQRKPKDIHIKELEEDLTNRFNRKVIVRGNSIQLSYHGKKDLNRLVEFLKTKL